MIMLGIVMNVLALVMKMLQYEICSINLAIDVGRITIKMSLGFIWYSVVGRDWRRVGVMRNDVARINRVCVIHLLNLNKAPLPPLSDHCTRCQSAVFPLSSPALFAAIATMHIESSQSARYRK